jgi:hypothetical protein
MMSSQVSSLGRVIEGVGAGGHEQVAEFEWD